MKLFDCALCLFKKILNNQRGSVVVLTALAMTAILGFAALVTDAGLIYFNRVKMVNAADAAALAAAQQLACGNYCSQSAKNIAVEYANSNKANLQDIQVDIDTDNNIVTVNLQKEVALCFARIFNIYSSDITAEAKATFEYPVKITRLKKGNVLPLFITREQYEMGLDEGDEIGLMGDSSFHVKINGEEVPGNWGALDFGPSAFDEALAGNLDISITISTGWSEMETKTGTMGINVKNAVDYRLFQDDDIEPYGLIPIVDQVEEKGGGKVEVHICGFAVFEITGTEKEPPGYTIYGHLIDDKTITDFTGDTSPQETYNYGSRVYKLIE